jgi:hypothetical protein
MDNPLAFANIRLHSSECTKLFIFRRNSLPGHSETFAGRSLTSRRFVGTFVGILLRPNARYQHAANGYEVPECEGANQATQALRWRRLAPLSQS